MRLTVAVAFVALSLTSAQCARAQTPLPSVSLPAELDRVLRDYERLWAAKDGAGLARIFAPDGFVMSSSTPPIRGRDAIQAQYSRTAGGTLRLRAFAYNTADTVGYIIGGYRYDQQDGDIGKFILAIKRERGGPWLIAADIDNGNSR